ncbi:CHAT domain-containing protein [Mycena sp. CBHHK59/15]|nr:CHAT domain-containing protein [Mycena sp. CBHHK59/15]
MESFSWMSLCREAVRLCPNPSPDIGTAWSRLAISLQNRYEQQGNIEDINEAIELHRGALAVLPSPHPNRNVSLTRLAAALQERFEQLGTLSDINMSIFMFEDALQLTPDGHPEKPLMLSNLSNLLFRRFERLGTLSDINMSIFMFEDALQLTPDGHPDKPLMLSNLGNLLFRRFERLGDLRDLNMSILTFEHAVQFTPDSHPNKPLMLSNLGNSLSSRFRQLGDSRDLLQAISQYSSASCSTTGPASIQLQASSNWALCAQTYQHPSLLQAYTVALDLLPQLAWLGLSISDRHYHILKAGQVVRDAAAAAIANYQYEKAVEWLEQGRSVIWGQLLQLRRPVEDLKQQHPDLAEHLIFLSTQLEGAGIRRSSPEVDSTGIQQSLGSIAQQYHNPAHEREELLKKIRGLEGFERFLLPRTISELSLAAQGGPVVTLNISEIRCDALILLPGLGDEVIHIPLTGFTLSEAQALRESLRSLLTYAGHNILSDADRLFGGREGHPMVPEEEFAHILSVLWLQVVKPVLDAVAITTPSKKTVQRIWWCPNGPLAFLPIHAAGLYGEHEPFGSKLSDFVISSYAPSLTALINGFRPGSGSQEGLQLLAVTQPSASGQSYLPGTQEEINHIQLHARGKLPVLRLEEDMATIDSVQKGMRESSWVHFACHGIQDASNPTESALLLAGSSRLTVSSIIRLSLPHADLAFLSACQTATGAEDLQLEESVHLAAGMLLAGYRGVIATMWSIMDNDAPQVAGDVYGHLFEMLPPDPTRAAEALHLAVRRLREEKKSFFHWVPFIHVGV